MLGGNFVYGRNVPIIHSNPATHSTACLGYGIKITEQCCSASQIAIIQSHGYRFHRVAQSSRLMVGASTFSARHIAGWPGPVGRRKP